MVKRITCGMAGLLLSLANCSTPKPIDEPLSVVDIESIGGVSFIKQRTEENQPYFTSDELLDNLVNKLSDKMKKKNVSMLIFNDFGKTEHYFFVEREDDKMYFGISLPVGAASVSDSLPLGSPDRFGYTYLGNYGDLPNELAVKAYRIMTMVSLSYFDKLKHPFIEKNGKLVEQKHVLVGEETLEAPEYLTISFKIEDYIHSRHPNK